MWGICNRYSLHQKRKQELANSLKPNGKFLIERSLTAGMSSKKTLRLAGHRSVISDMYKSLCLNPMGALYLSDKKNIIKLSNYWNMELVVNLGVNNNFVNFCTPSVPNILVYRQYFIKEHLNKAFNSQTHREILFGFSTGRCGFIRNQKRTSLATDVTMRAALWFCKRLYKFMIRVKVRFKGAGRGARRYLKAFERFELGARTVRLHSLVDSTPTPYNGVRRKAIARKRYRYHKYTYQRFGKLFARTGLVASSRK